MNVHIIYYLIIYIYLPLYYSDNIFYNFFTIKAQGNPNVGTAPVLTRHIILFGLPHLTWQRNVHISDHFSTYSLVTIDLI